MYDIYISLQCLFSHVNVSMISRKIWESEKILSRIKLQDSFLTSWQVTFLKDVLPLRKKGPSPLDCSCNFGPQNSVAWCFLKPTPFYVLPKKTLSPVGLWPPPEDVWFLSPGIGAQGGDLAKALKVGLRQDGLGILLPISRGWRGLGFWEWVWSFKETRDF